MFNITPFENIIICLTEFIAYIPIVTVCLYRYKKCKTHESWKLNNTLRRLWYIQLTMIINFLAVSLLFTVQHLLPIGGFHSFVEITRYVLGQAWFYLYASIQLLLCLLVSKTVLMCQKKNYSHLKNFAYGFAVPVVSYFMNIPMYFADDEAGSRFKEYDASVLSNTGALIVASMAVYCTYWLVTEFVKLINEIRQYKYTKESNAKSISSWRRFLVANIAISSMVFLYAAVDNIDELFTLKLLSVYCYGQNRGTVEYSLTRFLNTVLKYILSLILVFLSPYSSLKLKKNRKMNTGDFEPKRKSSIANSFEHDIEKKQ